VVLEYFRDKFCDNVEGIGDLAKQRPLWGSHITLVAAAYRYNRVIRKCPTTIQILAPGNFYLISFVRNSALVIYMHKSESIELCRCMVISSRKLLVA